MSNRICKTISPVDEIAIKPHKICIKNKLSELYLKYPLLPFSQCLAMAALEMGITVEELNKIL